MTRRLFVLFLTALLSSCSLATLAEESRLHQAAARGDVARIERLIDAGKDVNARTASGKTPLHEAAASGQSAAIKALAVKGADLNARDGKGRTPLYIAALAEQTSRWCPCSSWERTSIQGKRLNRSVDFGFERDFV